MGINNLVVNTDRLQSGKTIVLDEFIPACELQLEEKELSFPKPLHIQGQVYLADDHLIMRLDVEAEPFIVCSICNEKFGFPLEIKQVYTSVPLEELPQAYFDCSQHVRDALLLEVPQFAECNDGSCPERNTLHMYNPAKQTKNIQQDQPVHFPFEGLEDILADSPQ